MLQPLAFPLESCYYINTVQRGLTKKKKFFKSLVKIKNKCYTYYIVKKQKVKLMLNQYQRIQYCKKQLKAAKAKGNEFLAMLYEQELESRLSHKNYIK